jgi:hypothetical protein
MDINIKTFKLHHTYFVIGAFFNPETLEIDEHILLIPTLEIEKREAIKVKSNIGERYRVTTHLNPNSKSKWSDFIIKKSELADKLLEKFEEISQYLK